MSNITSTATFKKTLSVLEAFAKNTGLKFRIELDGASFGNLDGPTPTLKKKRYITSRKYGSITESFRDQLSTMGEGDIYTLLTPDLPDLNTSHYSSCVAAWCTTHWGKGNFMVSRNGKCVEVLRVR